MTTAIPVKSLGPETFLVGTRSLTTGALSGLAACAASGAYTSAGVFDVSMFRGVAVYLTVNGVASEVSARVGLFVGVSGVDQINGAKPTGTMDVWHAPSVIDGSVTATALGGALPGGQGFTATPSWGAQTNYGLLILHNALSAASDKLRIMYPLSTQFARWMQVFYAEHGDTAHPSQVAISYVGWI